MGRPDAGRALHGPGNGDRLPLALSRPLPRPLREGGEAMRVALFCHSILSDWNHGNAHFLRGVVTELVERGHAVKVYEPQDAWSFSNLISERGEREIERVYAAYPA